MKRIFLALFALALFYGTATAQYTTTIYTDTTLAGSSSTIAATALARGFTNFIALRSDANAHINRYVQIRFRGKTSAAGLAANSFTKDSVKVQGLLVKKAAANKMDTVWVDVPLTYPIKSAINTGAGANMTRDTTCYWLAAGQAEMGNANAYISPIMRLPNYFEEYRVVNAPNDSGRVVIKEIWERVR